MHTGLISEESSPQRRNDYYRGLIERRNAAGTSPT